MYDMPTILVEDKQEDRENKQSMYKKLFFCGNTVLPSFPSLKVGGRRSSDSTTMTFLSGRLGSVKRRFAGRLSSTSNLLHLGGSGGRITHFID